MPIFGFVLTLVPAAEPRRSLLAQLALEPGVTLGSLAGARLPLALEIDPGARAEDRVERWREMPGVVHVDYAFADFEDQVSDPHCKGEQT